MLNINFIIAILVLACLIALVTLAFVLRRWVWEIHNDAVRTREELHAFKRSWQAADAKQIQAHSAGILENMNASCLAPLGLKFPVFLGGWSIDSFLCRWLVQHLLEYRPKCIVELGSGSSTSLIARTLTLLGEKNTTHIAVDHERRYLDLTREVASLNGVAEHIEFLHCPLAHYDGLDKLWYGSLVEKLGDRKIDLLLIDGPPGPLQPLSRYPALPLLHSLFSEHCAIVLDDANRAEEQIIAKKWLEEYPSFKLTFLHEGHGLAILER